jgi:ABC-type cobalamin transport system ATPase subunit
VPGPMVVRIVEGYASDLQNELNMLVTSGQTIHFITPNGVNRWTIVAMKGLEVRV